MRYFIVLIIFVSLAACNNPDPLREKIQMEVTNITTQDISVTGNIIEPVKINKMDIEKISMQQYYQYQWEEQDSLFKKFMNHVSKLKTQVNFLESQLTHDNVMAYLANAIKTASSKPEIYKVHYNLKAATQRAKYNRRQVTFLDSTFKKIEPDYSFLKKNTN